MINPATVFRTIQGKIILLIILLVLIFFSGIYIQRESEANKITLLLHNEEEQKNIVLRQTVELQGKSLESFAYDYTYWDELFNFVIHPDSEWAHINIDEVLSTFNAQGVWILDRNFKHVYSIVKIDEPELIDSIFLKSINLSLLRPNPFQQFYLWGDKGLLEFRTAPIQPSDDVQRITEPHGYFITLRLWDQKFIREMETLLSSSIKIITHDVDESIQILDESESISITSSIVLLDQDKNPIAQLLAVSKSQIIGQMLILFNYQYNLTIIFAAIIIIAVSVFLFLFVNSPLRLITQSLAKEDPVPISNLAKTKNEFGNYASLILQFFLQKQNLEKEITERESAESALRESEKLYKTIFDTSADAYVILDNKFNAAYMNHRFTELSAFHLSDLKQKNYFNVIKHNTEIIDIEIAAREAFIKIIGPFDSTVQRLDGGNIELNMIISPISITNTPLILLRYTDITETKKYEFESKKHQKQMQQADKLASLGLLVAGVAHEINNPNAFISVNIPYIKQYFYEIFPILDDYYLTHPDFKIGKIPYSVFKDDVKDLLSDLREGSERITTIVNDLKDFAKVDSEIKMRDCNLKKILLTAARLLAPKIKAKNASIIFNEANDNVIVKGDAHKLGQVIINLLMNALEALDDKDGQINISFNRSIDGTLICSIKDNGNGISAVKIESVFDPFYTTKENMGGTGLGLSVSRSIMESMGYSINLESEENKGTTALLIFPERT